MNIYGFAPVTGGCHWYRIREPLRGLAGIGHMTEFGEILSEEIVRRHDTILAHMLHDPEASQGWAWLQEAGQHRLVYDIDDNIWAWQKGTDHARYWTRERLDLAERNIRLAHLVTTPSFPLATVIERKGLNANVAVLPNLMPRWTLNIPRTLSDVFTIGYQGAPQKLHQSDLDTIQGPLFGILKDCPDARLLFFGQPRPLDGAGPFADRIRCVPWTPDVPAYYRSLTQMTVGIGPLKASRSTDSKSGIRAVEFQTLGIPGVYSDAPAYQPWVSHRVTGFLAKSSADWYTYLKWLYDDADMMRLMGQRARDRARAWEEWTTEANATLWERAYQNSGPGKVVASA
jgi:hypothetical protein